MKLIRREVLPSPLTPILLSAAAEVHTQRPVDKRFCARATSANGVRPVAGTPRTSARAPPRRGPASRPSVPRQSLRAGDRTGASRRTRRR